MLRRGGLEHEAKHLSKLTPELRSVRRVAVEKNDDRTDALRRAEAETLEAMRLANVLCRYVELADPVQLPRSAASVVAI